MPQPTKSQVHVDRPLTNISTAYIQGADSFVSDKAFPPVPVQKQSDQYFTYDKNDWFRSVAKVRAPGSESAGGGYTLSTATYSCLPVAVHKDIDEQTRANSDDPLNPDRDATLWVTQQLLLKREIDWASKYFAINVWANTDQTGVASDSPAANQCEQWDRDGSTPIDDVAEQMQVVLDATGFLPNTLVLPYAVYRVLKNHADMLDRIKYNFPSGDPAKATPAMIAAVLDLERVLVAKSVKNTSKEGNATQTVAAILGKGALLCYAPPNPGLMTPSAGYTFEWVGLLGSGVRAGRIKRFRIEHLESDRVEGELAYDQKVVGADLGVYFATIVG